MKKIITFYSLLLAITLLAGCAKQQINQTQPSLPEPLGEQSDQPIAGDQTTSDQSLETDSDISDELAQYGEETEQIDSHNQTAVYQAPEIGLGSLVNADANKSIDKWYFLPEGKNKEKYLLIIDDKCLVDTVGFMNGSCLKYLGLDKNKNIIYDGYNGPAIIIHGDILINKTIQVSNITIVQ